MPNHHLLIILAIGLRWGCSLDMLKTFLMFVLDEASSIRVSLMRLVASSSEKIGADVKSEFLHETEDVANEVGHSTAVELEAVELEAKLAPGCLVDGLDEAFLLYCDYAKHTGFSVRKGNQERFSKTKEVRMKTFVCSCRGLTPTTHIEGRLAVYKKHSSRCNCQALLRIARVEGGPWKVTTFIKDHNHELFPKDQAYLLSSSRHISHTKKSMLEALHSAGIPISRACRFMENEAGGPENTGFIRRDVYHHMDNVRRKSKMADGVSIAFMQYFVDKSNKEPFFYWNMQKDDEGRLMNFFYRDSRSALDYEYFGDVLFVDTTYKTNKYDLICAPFVGINHHLKNCMFGMAFLLDETTETFEWLFLTFLESMNAKEPEVVFSDQCQALMNGIDGQFKAASHRLCQWHINQNAPSHFGSLNGNNDFKRAWHHCMNWCESEEEFESLWKKMIEDYGLAEHMWFGSMYKLRKRWALVFINSRFSAGLHATSRSEVTNKVLKDLCASSGSLFDFVQKYEQIQKDWRVKERATDALCIGTPGQFVEHNPLVMAAAKHFTRAVFVSYEFEANHSLNVSIIGNPTVDDVQQLRFVVKTTTNPLRSRFVIFHRTSHEASCSCRLWETSDILCRHIFRIYYHMNVQSIPKKYLLRRFSKDAKTGIGLAVGEGNTSHTHCHISLPNSAMNSHIMRGMYELLNDDKLDETSRQIIVHKFDELQKEI
ncbi:protein FAR1-RELATED SEQUENCE 5-like [Salvia miltiorrhiza]|uniref:protein FAR1-RELATED SEQUENCE 5-like n=1 Tax=Salvia miltiorrhiza TaxID=226208 RepID=UPI0025AC4F0F|nr:protein FAR1-RELATED SEQUENCE 5-like [Salvia miltiorrhiza]